MTRNIRGNDVQAMLRLVNELHALPPDPTARQQHLLQSLCRLLDAKIGVIVHLADGTGPRWQFRSPAVIDFGWPCERQRRALLAYREDMAREPARYADPMEEMLQLPGTVVTRRRDELHDDSRWYASAYVNEHRRSAEVDDCLYTLHRMPGRGAMVGLGMHRAWGERRRFGQREADLLHLINEQLQFLWGCDVPQGQEGLAPRVRQTLGLMLRGYSEKEIASRLNLSRNTVHKYVTAVYRHFGVTSRAELMARQIGGGTRLAGDFPDVVDGFGACNADDVN